MPSKLSSLPPSIIDRILGFDDTSYLSMTLWLVGNRKLNKLLSESVTYVELRNEGEFDLCFLPLYLTNLRCLRHLVIHRVSLYKYLHIADRKRTVSVVQGLSDTLETIIFRFRHSTKLFFPDYPNSTPHVSVEKSFPSLSRLQLDTETSWHPSFISHLPLTITDLQVAFSDDQRLSIMDMMRSLPTSLRHLTIIPLHDPNWPSFHDHTFDLLPPHLESLVLMLRDGQTLFAALTPDCLAQLPKSLIFVRLLNHSIPKGRSAIEGTCHADPVQALRITQWLPETGPSLPPFISGLLIHALALIKIIPAIQTFPIHLETLCLALPGLEMEPPMIRALPRRLTSLQARFKHFKGLEKDDFPSTLRELNITRADKIFSASQALMLPSLTSLTSYSQLPAKVVDSLPRTITNLNVWVDSIKDHTLPPNLRLFRYAGTLLGTLGLPKANGKIKKLKMNWHVTPPTACAFEHPNFTTFPKTLTWLSVSLFVIPVSILQHLPPSLTHLILTRIYDDSLFDPSDPDMLARIKCLSGTENYDPSPSNGKPHATIADFMPRSLKFLQIVGALDSPIESWRRLPPSLTFLSLQPLGTFDKAILQHLPLKHLRHLVIRITGFDDDDVALLPRSLRHISVGIPTNLMTFTEKSLYHAGLIDLFDDTDPRRDVWMARFQQTQDLLDRDDVTALKGLQSS